MRNPELAAAAWEVGAAGARTLQASLRPNPEFELEVEEFAGTGETSGFDAATSTFALGQEIELGGKRQKRTEVAGLERRLAKWDYDAKRLEVLAETTVAFVEVLAAQEKLELAKETVAIAERTLGAVSERVKAGKVSPLEKMQAEVALSTSRVELERTRDELGAARETLPGKWGGAEPTFEKAKGDLGEVGEVPPLERLLELASASPEVARWGEELGLRKARVALQRANRTPDLGVRAGIQRLAESEDTAFMVGVSIPLPLFDRNQGGILEAERELAGAHQKRRAAEVRTRTKLRRAYRELRSARREAVSLRDKVLPAARRAFDAAHEGYQRGKFGYLDVLGAQKALFEVRQSAVEALASYRIALAGVEKLAGLPLERLERAGKPGVGERKEQP
ncbi:MAG: TolC family protein [Planctomycetota bacterium]